MNATVAGQPQARRPTLVGVRWFVDGMNVIGSRPDAWWRDRDRAMLRLVLVNLLQNAVNTPANARRQ